MFCSKEIAKRIELFVFSAFLELPTSANTVIFDLSSHCALSIQPINTVATTLVTVHFLSSSPLYKLMLSEILSLIIKHDLT